MTTHILPHYFRLEEKLNPIMEYQDEQIFQTGDCQALILLGKDMLHSHPITIDQFEALESTDNIQNFVILLENKMFPEVLLVGQCLEVPPELSYQLRKNNLS